MIPTASGPDCFFWVCSFYSVLNCPTTQRIFIVYGAEQRDVDLRVLYLFMWHTQFLQVPQKKVHLPDLGCHKESHSLMYMNILSQVLSWKACQDLACLAIVVSVLAIHPYQLLSVFYFFILIGATVTEQFNPQNKAMCICICLSSLHLYIHN